MRTVVDRPRKKFQTGGCHELSLENNAMF